MAARSSTLGRFVPLSATMSLTSFAVDSPLPTHPPVSDSNTDLADRVIGAAIFDLNGLPKEYFVTSDNNNISWVQTIFQALGLQSLLMSSLKLEGFHHAIIRGQDCNAVIVKQRNAYVALLIRSTDDIPLSHTLVNWVHDFEVDALRNHPRFRVA